MRSITVRLALAFAAVALVAAAVTAAGMRVATTGRFGTYRQGQAARQVEALQELFAGYYEASGSWQGVERLLWPAPAARRMGPDGGSPGPGAGPRMGAGRPPGAGGGPGFMGLGPARIQLTDTRGIVVASNIGPTGGVLGAAGGLPVLVGGVQVGTLWVDLPGMPPTTPLEEEFARGISYTAVYGGLVAAGLAMLLGIVLARRITRPVSTLAAATRAVARKDLTVRVPDQELGLDELGALGRDFNRMADRLAEQERLRRTLIADVAHELRTPVAILKGQFEAIQDGVTAASPETLLPLHDEALRLARLVDDLQSLALADAGQLPLQRRPATPADLVGAAAAAFGPAATAQEIRFTVAMAADLPAVDADPDRIKQVLLNLLGNALRHTRSGGRIGLSATLAGGSAGDNGAAVAGKSGEDMAGGGRTRDAAVRRRFVTFAVSDNGEGIAPADLPHVFDRFWRADKSRSRSAGGSGLGLAIARGIVTAHGGEMAVASTPDAGSCFSFVLPVSPTGTA